MTRALLLFCALAVPALAQTYNPRTVVFSGTSADQPSLSALAAIPAGKPVTAKEIDDAMNRLADTGLFADVRYTVDDRALTFVLTPQPPALMLPVVYANFLLWKPGELTPLVHAHLPLFTGSVPTTGNFQQTVADALTAILLDKGIAGKVEAVLGKARNVSYSITQPAVRIGQVHVESVSATASAKLSAMLQSFASTDFDPGSAQAVHDRIVTLYLDLGFLDIAVDQPTLGAPAVSPASILVDVSTTAHEGGQYHVTKLDWPATPIVKVADFQKASPLKPGDPASRIELLSTTARAEDQFTQRGYLDAKVSPHEQKDAAAHSIAYTFTAEPGELYHVRTVRFVGMTAEQQKDFERLWAMPPGSPLDGTYTAGFMARNSNVASFQGFAMTTQITPNRGDHTADLTIGLKRRPQR